MTETNPNSRLEAFCDGVFAIAITLLIIDIKLPSPETMTTTADLWLAIKHIGPSIYAFVLSFTIILITWVNHHGTMKLIRKTSAPFIFANGFLLLTVVFMPFPTALVGEYLLTDHSSPAVILYVGTMGLQAIGWILLTGAALGNQLGKDDKSIATIREQRNYGYFGFLIYSLYAVIAFWYPLAIAVLTTLTWIFWLILAIKIKHD